MTILAAAVVVVVAEDEAEDEEAVVDVRCSAREPIVFASSRIFRRDVEEDEEDGEEKWMLEDGSRGSMR